MELRRSLIRIKGDLLKNLNSNYNIVKNDARHSNQQSRANYLDQRF